MAYNNERANVHGPLVLDIETVTLENAADYIDPPEAIPEPDYGAVTPAANLKDPIKILESISNRRAAARADWFEAKAKAQAAYVAKLEAGALDPDLCRVVAIGVQRDASPYVRVIDGLNDKAESDLLVWFWKQTQTPDTFIGFNMLTFDLPVLMRRSLYLGIHHAPVNLDRYRTPHIDLMQRLSFNGVLKFRGLDFYTKRFGIDVPDPTTGRDMAALVKAGMWTEVANHCRADIQKTAALARRLGVLAEQEVAEVL
jgi:predicted PolB exonuclease-like 3'-5' exonuclease